MTLASQYTLFDEILDFLSSTPTPETIVAFHPSEQLQSRASDLLEKNRQGKLSSEELSDWMKFSA